MQKGFTLIELSIVLVIIGLIVGGVLVGQDLIKAAEIRSVITDYERFQTATNTFRLKYNCLAGDCTNATQFFGPAASCPGTASTPSTDITTCNGDGNKRIDLSTLSDERFRFWQHLANADLIEGQYSGVVGPGGSLHTNEDNAPTGKRSGSQWSVQYSIVRPDNVPTNNFIIGGGLTFTFPANAIFSPDEALKIDDKIDDGLPRSGLVLGANGNGGGQCVDTGPTTPIYDTTDLINNPGLQCRLSIEAKF